MNIQRNIGRLSTEDTALLVIDIQERLMPVIYNSTMIFENTNRLLKGADVLDLPILVTEQYPKGLQHTCQQIELPADYALFEKICFSCIQSDPILDKLRSLSIKSLIVCGVEAHICVLKTVLDALQEGFDVHVIADAVSSRTPANRQLALDRMRQSGAFIASTEMVLFQLIETAGNQTFKQISGIIK
ncbi:MAG: hydrolase [Saprospiraceae bacterium]|nr:hydrolase [Saprospiraceae bacterium]